MKLFKILLDNIDIRHLLSDKDVNDLFSLPLKEVLEMGFKIELCKLK